MSTIKKVLKFKKFKIANLNMRFIQGGGDKDTIEVTSICPTNQVETCKAETCTCTTGVPASHADNQCSDRCFGDGLGG